MGLSDWAKRWARAPIFKIKAGKRQLPARHAMADRYRKKYRAAVQTTLARMVREAASKVRGGSKTPFSTQDITRWTRALYEAQIKILLQIVGEAFRLTGRELAGAGASKATTSPDGFLIQKVQPSAAKWLKKIASRQTRAFADRIQKVMRTAQGYWDEDLGRGMTPAEIAGVLLDEGLAATEARAEMIARTNTIWAANEGAMAKYEEAGVGVMEWLATEDDLTCEFCMELDGKAVEIGNPFLEAGTDFGVEGGDGEMAVLKIPDAADVDHPPVHPNCRCTIVPVL